MESMEGQRGFTIPRRRTRSLVVTWVFLGAVVLEAFPGFPIALRHIGDGYPHVPSGLPHDLHGVVRGHRFPELL